jgi:hypothetical protein
MPFKWDRVLRPRCLNPISQSRLMDDDHGANSLQSSNVRVGSFASKAAEAVRPCTSAARPKADVNSPRCLRRFDAMCRHMRCSIGCSWSTRRNDGLCSNGITWGTNENSLPTISCISPRAAAPSAMSRQ